MKPLNQTLKKILKPTLKNKALSVAELKIQWPHIVGQKWGAHSRPQKLIRNYNKSSLSGGVLHIDVDPYLAMEMQYELSNICAKINQFYGYNTVQRISLTQTPVFHDKKKSKPKTLIKLTEAEQHTINKQAISTKKTELADALKNFGYSIVRNNKNKGQKTNAK